MIHDDRLEAFMLDTLMYLAAEERRRELARSADAERLARAATDVRRRREIARSHVTLRLDRVDDADRLVQLAQLSDRELPDGPFAVAEVEGVLVAALPVLGGPALRDPFVATAHLVPLLELRAAQIRGVELRLPRRLWLRLRRA